VQRIIHREIIGKNAPKTEICNQTTLLRHQKTLQLLQLLQIKPI